ncbi:MAG: N-acetylmuramoyl-L-alanine amidase-like domain-containing protein [Bacteroidota bacterium]
MKVIIPFLCSLLLTLSACQDTANSQTPSESIQMEAVSEVTPLPSYDIHCTAQNAALCQSHLEGLQLAKLGDLPIHQIAIEVGKRFMGTPYVAKTLEIEGEERLVVDMQGLDCTTFLENVVVMARLTQQDRLSLDQFHAELGTIRYRDGELEGYSSRLHYFTEWIHNNQEKGIIRDISQQIGGLVYDKPIDFMSTHRDAYAQLSDDGLYQAIQKAEGQLNQTYPRYFIPKDQVQAVESRIQDGDLIAITTSIKGLDVVHTGFALHQKGRLHLFHASSGSKEVEISQKPLAEYLAGIKHQSGIMVCRLTDG